MSTYDDETQAHVDLVKRWMTRAGTKLVGRSNNHDRSKFNEPERSGFQAMSEELKLADAQYGSDEYRAILRAYKPTTIGHHYECNDHHPEHFPDGISGMSLLSLLEMLCDWKAATERMKDGDIAASLAINADRFGIEPQLMCVLVNTARELGMFS